MGVLTASGSMPDVAPGVSDPPEPETPTPKPEPEPKPEPTKDFVPFSRIERHAGSRRDRAQREIAELIDNRVKPLEDRLVTEREQYEQRIQQQAHELARLEGQYRALQESPRHAAPAPPARPDPDALIRDAEAALERNDLRGYHAKWRDAQDAIADRRAEERVKALEARLPPQVDPYVSGLMAKHGNIAMAGQRGIEAVMIKDRELGIYGTQPGPARLAKAFELADEMLTKIAKPAPRSQYSSDSAAALAGTPAARNSSGSAPRSEPGYQPTDADRAVMKSMGWNAEEFVKWKHPERWLKR